MREFARLNHDLILLRAEHAQVQRAYTQMLLEMVERAQRVFKREQAGLEAVWMTTRAEYGEALSQSLTLKLATLRLERLQRMYHFDVIHVLRNERQVMGQEREQLQERSRQLQAQLQPYQMLGNALHGIVRAYANTLKEIDMMKEELKRLRGVS